MAYDVYRKFAVWLKKKGLMRFSDANDTIENEDALASCLRCSLGIGQVIALDEAGDVQCSQEQADEKRFALRKSAHTGEYGGFSVHAGVTVHAADEDGRERLIRYCARPALSMERMTETRDGLIAYRLRHAQQGNPRDKTLHLNSLPGGRSAQRESTGPPWLSGPTISTFCRVLAVGDSSRLTL